MVPDDATRAANPAPNPDQIRFAAATPEEDRAESRDSP